MIVEDQFPCDPSPSIHENEQIVWNIMLDVTITAQTVSKLGFNSFTVVFSCVQQLYKILKYYK